MICKSKLIIFFILMDNTNVVSICMSTLVILATTFEAQRPLSETYNNKCYLVETIECLGHDQLNIASKQP